MKNNSKMLSIKKSLVLATIAFSLTIGSAQTDSKSTELVDALIAVNGGDRLPPKSKMSPIEVTRGTLMGDDRKLFWTYK